MSKLDVNHLEDYAGDLSTYKDEEIFEWAKMATDQEHLLTFREGLKSYPKAIFWAIVLSLTIVMEGYDDNLIGNFYA